MTARTPLIVDVDTGIDDSLALLYLLARDDADIVAVLSTAGNVPTAQVANNNLAWLELCGRTDVEVAVGADGPLSAPLRTTEDTHGPQGIGYAILPTPTHRPSDRTATQAWVDLTRERPGEMVGLVTGPLTNLALAIRTDPGLPARLRRLVIMGGAFHHPGNTTPVAEWNISVDPEAAAEVFAAFSAVPVDRAPIVCGLDVTERIVLRPEHLRRLAELSGSTPAETIRSDDAPSTRSVTSNPVVRHLSDAVRFYFEFHRDHGQGFIAHMHDPFAAAVALDPDLAQYRPATVDVETEGRITRGQTVADWFGLWGRPPNARVAWDTDPDAFLDDLVGRVAAFASTMNQSARRDPEV
ncbi:nucleoside hydrolase [Rhodococcus spongiicola]|uniref:Nucleoside hydrolase n=1 Tax=Rhodococcus spongiicola TaxID=2487352 RepID=A0A3S3BK80_9NOCA|nr:nucleoside hydrolase [Rhodococcus spongiicola]RVW03335.1 nucleoside hydrolase [Rhodococcus spongiicola]